MKIVERGEGVLKYRFIHDVIYELPRIETPLILT